MIKKGDAHHIVNNQEQILTDGNLLFIRDFDTNEYKRAEGKFFYALNEVNQSYDKKTVRLKLKELVVKVFTNYFQNHSYVNNNIPLWLEMTYKKMKKSRNFIAGTDRMYELSGKSREHLCRSMKENYGTTPSALVNDLRLEYCANLLMNSNLSVTDICYSSGYDNLSWFYKVFCNKFGVTPSKYRKIRGLE